jgi:hypothetical protein
VNGTATVTAGGILVSLLVNNSTLVLASNIPTCLIFTVRSRRGGGGGGGGGGDHWEPEERERRNNDVCHIILTPYHTILTFLSVFSPP